MTLVEHLVELRRRVLICVAGVVAGSVLVYVFFDEALAPFVAPYFDETGQDALIFTGPLEGFTTRLKFAAYGGLVLALPVVLWQLWRFVTPALHPREKRHAAPFVMFALAAFSLGGFCAYLMIPRALRFFVNVGGDEFEPLLAAEPYLTFVVVMVVGIGLVFETPVVLGFLLKARVVTTAQLRRTRRWVIVGIALLAALATPPDPQTQMLVAIPLWISYEMAILVGRVMHR